jgi:FkbM family methyltransferase
MRVGRLWSRAELLKGYFARERNFRVGLRETFSRGVFKVPCTAIGRRYVCEIEDAGEYQRVYFHGISRPLYWPRRLGTFDLYKAVTDCLHENDWHHYEVPETRVQPGDIVLDCGAAEGLFALSVVARASRVVIFEPCTDFVGGLARTFDNASNVSIVHAALGSSPGKAFLAGSSLYGVVTTGQTGVPIDVTTIDDWAASTYSRVDFIKGDLESEEFEVLKGGQRTIRRDKPKIALTVYHPGNNWSEMAAFLKGLVPEYRFRIKGLSYNGGRPRPVMLHAWVHSDGK